MFLKKNKKTRTIPVIMLSANNDAESIAKKSGADGFLSKPFDMQDLLDLLERFLQKEVTP
jgi:two-component system cell cycle response regulator DivK